MAFHFQPYALPPHSGSDDISDVWTEETDPENERGECCEAFYDDEVSGFGSHSAIVALCITGGWDDQQWSINLPRDIAMKLLTPPTIARLERLRADRLETQRID